MRQETNEQEIERLPFTYDGEEVGLLIVERRFLKVREYKFHPSDAQAEAKRATFALEVARFAPDGFGMIAKQVAIAPDDPAELAEGFLYDRFVFVRRGAFVFRTHDGRPPHRFTLRTRSDGLKFYVVTKDGEPEREGKDGE